MRRSPRWPARRKTSGFAASYSTTYHPAPILADKFATIQRLSQGRAGWNMVTSGDIAARNFGSGRHPERAVRYAKAHETVEGIKASWANGLDLPGASRC